jgi:heme exporter protein CcmD
MDGGIDIHMGSYGVYVYGSYALMLLVVIGNWLSARRHERRAQRQVKARLTRAHRP